jgi:hypothetical protein
VTEQLCSVTFVTVTALIGASRCLAKLLLSTGFLRSALRGEAHFLPFMTQEKREFTINSRLRAVKIKLLLRSGLP